MKRYSSPVIFKKSNKYSIYQVKLGERLGYSSTLIGSAHSSSTYQNLGLAVSSINSEFVDILPTINHVANHFKLTNFVLLECSSELFLSWALYKNDDYYLNKVSSFEDIVNDFKKEILDSKVKQFDVAECSLGVKGVILSESPEGVEYADGNEGFAWTGLVIEDIVIDGIKGHAGKKIDIKAGALWSSKYPKVIKSYDMNSIPDNIKEIIFKTQSQK